jgi:8-oxo-dGTP pyrophosphatase MutT (NUDIX family)
MAWVEPARWYAQLAAFHAAASVLLTDEDGRVLLVKPNYRDHWLIPGGYVDQHENPHKALARELHEELGLKINPGPLLVIDWASPAGNRPRPIIAFLFDGGQASSDDIQLNPDELDSFGFFESDRCRELLPPSIAPRIDAALEARASSTTVYLADGVTPVSS